MEGIRLRDPIAFERLKKAKEYELELRIVNLLHERGYDYFTIPTLTIPEIVMLIDIQRMIEYETKKYKPQGSSYGKRFR